jgi:NAD(P)-dependent dehydrogenase (short-subunit alcohol dehydrogenase family)
LLLVIAKKEITMPFPEQQQQPPGLTEKMDPRPDHGEESYTGSGKLEGKVALITGADSGIGKAVAIAYAREGADVVISYLSETEDADDTARWVRDAGRKAVVVGGDLADPQHCRDLVDQTVAEFGRLDILVSNAAFQMTHETIEEIPDEEWEHTIATNLSAYFHLVKAALPHLGEGASIIGSSSVNSDTPSPTLMPYAATKAGIANMSASMAQLLGPRGIRVNSVAPGPIWTPLIPSTMPNEKVAQFGDDTPLGRAGQPAELAPVYVLLASDEGSYISGARVAVTGGRPIL